MTQRNLAAKSGVPVSSINGMMTGKKSYSTENLIAVSEALHISLDMLLKDEPGPSITVDAIPSTMILDGAYRVQLSRLDIPVGPKKENSK